MSCGLIEVKYEGLGAIWRRRGCLALAVWAGLLAAPRVGCRLSWLGRSRRHRVGPLACLPLGRPVIAVLLGHRSRPRAR